MNLKKRRISVFLMMGVLLLMLSACGGGGGGSGDDGSNGGPVTADVLVIGTDFTTSVLSTVSLENLSVERNLQILDSGDNVAVAAGEYVFVIRRLGTDAVQVFNRNDFSTVLADYSVRDPDGGNANPYDLLMLGTDKAYVTRYELASLLIVNPLTGARLGTIDLSAFADADAVPEMHHVLLAGGKVYVSLERVDRNAFFAPTDFSALAIINPAADEVIGSVVLEGLNPVQTKYVPELDRIVSACVGSYFAEDGGLEAVNPVTDASEGFLVTEADLGLPGITGFEFISADEVFILGTTATFGTEVHRVNLITRTSEVVAASAGFDFFAIALVEDRLLVADQNSARPGVRVFSVADNSELTDTPLDAGLLPYFLLSLR